MKKNKILKASLLIGLGILIGAIFNIKSIEKMVFGKQGQLSQEVMDFKVIGDVEKAMHINTLAGFSITEMEHRGERKEFITLKEVIEASIPLSTDFEIMLVGSDGLMAKIDGAGIEECYMTFSVENGWEFVNLNHPINSNIKKVKEVVILSKEESWENGVNVITEEANLLTMTPGQMYMKIHRLYPYFEGTSSVEKGEKIYETTIYTTRRMVKIKDLLQIDGDNKLLAMGKKGEYDYIDQEGFIELKDNRIDYIHGDSKEGIKDLKGIFINPPVSSIMDTCYDTLHFLERDERVLILFLDGFGFGQYTYAVENGYAPFLSSLEKAKKATTVYQPVTNAGFAAMITGQPPCINGVPSRAYRELKVPSLFGKVQEMNKKGILIEGDIQILNTEIEPILNLDRNKNGSTDEEVMESAMEHIESQYDLMMVHFHGIDDMGHQNGPYAQETLEKIKEVDQYIQGLMDLWEGKVIITADHGMHETVEGGSHGAFRFEDMVVPYFLIEGGGHQ